MDEPTGPSWTTEALRLRWSERQTLRQIGKHLGVSGERVRQILQRYGAEGRLPPQPDVSEFASASSFERQGLVKAQTIARWVRAGIIEINEAGLVHRQDVLDHVVEMMERPCTSCGNPIASVHSRHIRCADCAAAAAAYYYPFMNEGQRQAHQARIDNWKARNPRAAQEIYQRAQQAYRERQRSLKR